MTIEEKYDYVEGVNRYMLKYGLDYSLRTNFDNDNVTTIIDFKDGRTFETTTKAYSPKGHFHRFKLRFEEFIEEPNYQLPDSYTKQEVAIFLEGFKKGIEYMKELK